MTEVKEGTTTPHKCSKGNPPHNWYIAASQTPEESKAKKRAEAQSYRDQDARKAQQAIVSKMPPPTPRFESEARGADFEAKAIEENEKKGIRATAVFYKCHDCPEEMEVDIEFEDGQLGEAQSESARNYDTDKRKSKQAKVMKDIQRHVNAQKSTTHQPLAKFDGNTVDDPALARRSTARRGVTPEIIP